MQSLVLICPCQWEEVLGGYKPEVLDRVDVRGGGERRRRRRRKRVDPGWCLGYW